VIFSKISIHQPNTTVGSQDNAVVTEFAMKPDPAQLPNRDPFG